MGEQTEQTDRYGAPEGFRFFLNSNFFTGKILFLGLLVAQIIATIHIYLSNTGLFHTLEHIKNAGYLTIPNDNVIKSLLEFGPAFYGGLFFSLSTGALLSLLGLVSAFIWVQFFKRKKPLLIPFLILWAGLIGAVNINGFCPVITIYFLFIPSIVFIAVSRWMPSVQYNKNGSLSLMIRIIPVFLIAILWILQMNNGMFTNIRDYLLLSNSPGIKVNNFYYLYTLYPAEAIKSLEQKLIKTYRLDNLSDDYISDQIKKKLINCDYIEVKENAAVDLTIEEQNNSLNIGDKGKIILTVSTGDFLSNTESRLKEFSSRIDRLNFFRLFTYISLLTGFPAIMIILFYSILGAILNLYFNYRRSCTISLYLCLTAAVLLSAFFYHVSGKSIEEENLPEALRSARWQDQVTALKIIDEKKMDISRFRNYREMLSSTHIPVRYWLAKVLGTTGFHDSYNDLLILMDDQCPNVVCMAYSSLGQRGDKSAISKILKRIQLSDHWYEQLYAYKALRALGWKQPVSN